MCFIRLAFQRKLESYAFDGNKPTFVFEFSERFRRVCIDEQCSKKEALDLMPDFLTQGAHLKWMGACQNAHPETGGAADYCTSVHFC